MLPPVALLLLILPGYALVRAIFPGRGQMRPAMEGLYLALFTVVGGVAVVVLYTFALILLAQASPGVNPFNVPVVAGGLFAITLALGAVGWWRGAYGWLGHLHPSLSRRVRGGPAEPRSREDLERLRELALERDWLKAQLRGRGGDGDITMRLEVLHREIRALEARLREGME